MYKRQVLERKTSVLKFIKTLIVVYIGNLAGGLLLSALAVYGHTMSAFDGVLAQSIVGVAQTKCTIGFGDGIIRGVLCNILVCLAVWMTMTTKSAAGKIVALYLPIMVFVICGFEHSVANMFYIPTGIMSAKEYGINAVKLLLPQKLNAQITFGFEDPYYTGKVLGWAAVLIPIYGCLLYTSPSPRD